jgi:Rrf2 family protein
MAHLTVSVEYGIHSLLWLVDSDGTPLSSRDLAELQGISHSLLAKIFPKLEKAGIVRASDGVRGGYLLARAAEDISFLEIVDAIEGRKPLFDCQDIRGRCAVFGTLPPTWATNGVCSVHVVMLRAEKAMRDTLAGHSLAQLARAVTDKAPADFSLEVQHWLGERIASRTRRARPSAARSLNREVPS